MKSIGLQVILALLASSAVAFAPSSSVRKKRAPPIRWTVLQQSSVEANGFHVPSTVQVQQPSVTEKERTLTLMKGLALNSGFLNGVFLSGVLGRIQAVGPVTDSWTKQALACATGDAHRMVFVAQVLASFGLGAFAAGFMNPDPDVFTLKQRQRPLLGAGLLMALATALVVASASSGVQVPPLAFFLVCAANGMQNSFSSFATNNMCRTSHFTGTTTDLFTILGQCLRGNNQKKERIPIYTQLTAMFWLGGFLGTRWTKTLADASICLGVSTLFYFTCALPYKRIFRRQLHRSN